MNNYGFELVTADVAQQMGLPNATGLFKDLFDSMCKLNKRKTNTKDYGTAIVMTEEEKKISFMNRFFVFQKKRNILDANLVQKMMNEELDNLIVETDNIKINKLEERIVINPAIRILKRNKRKPEIKIV
jgi:hypothetical protein